MGRLFGKKSKKKTQNPSQRHEFLRTPAHANVAVGPLGFQPKLDVDSKGERRRSTIAIWSRPDWFRCVAPDENGTGASRIVFQDKESD